MGNAGCHGAKSNYKVYKQEAATNEFYSTFTLIWLDNAKKKDPKLKNCLKQIGHQLIKFDNDDLCETYVKDRPNNHFILIVCHELGNNLVPEIHDLAQLDSIFVYDFLSNVTFKKWMEKWNKVIHFFRTEIILIFYSYIKIIQDVFTDLDQLESSIIDRVGYLKKVHN